MRLVETGGRTSQDLGLGRIVGQILVYLYLQPAACSLEELEENLGLSQSLRKYSGEAAGTARPCTESLEKG